LIFRSPDQAKTESAELNRSPDPPSAEQKQIFRQKVQSKNGLQDIRTPNTDISKFLRTLLENKWQCPPEEYQINWV
jgi:hypothetical protein